MNPIDIESLWLVVFLVFVGVVALWVLALFAIEALWSWWDNRPVRPTVRRPRR